MSEWFAYLYIRGLPQERAAYSAGQICAVLANIHRDKDAKVFSASDFVVALTSEDVEEQEDEAEPDAEIDIAADLQLRSKAIAKMLGRKDAE